MKIKKTPGSMAVPNRGAMHEVNGFAEIVELIQSTRQRVLASANSALVDLRLCIQERWSNRQLERQLAGALFERTTLSSVKFAPPVREFHPDAASVFEDTYLVEFLNLPRQHPEADLHKVSSTKLRTS